MLTREDLISIAGCHVEHGRQRVERQQSVIANMQLAGLDTRINEDVLRLFERHLSKFEGDLARVSAAAQFAVSPKYCA